MATKQTINLPGIVAAITIAIATYVILPGGDGGIFKPDCSAYKPGDTIKLSGKYTYAYFDGLKGDSLHPIIIDGQNKTVLANGFDFKNCQYWKVINFTVDQNNVNPNSVAISIHGYSSHGEFANFNILNSGYGFWIKNEHDDLIDTNVSYHVLDYFSIHDFTMKNIAQHGTYIGATEYPNKTRDVTINGIAYYPNPSMVGHIKIYNGVIRHTGKNGLMICLAKYGMSEVYNVDIDSTGMWAKNDPLHTQDQGAGLQFGFFTNVYAHDNKVNHTWLWGIRSFGADTVRIENNTVSNSGNNGEVQLNWPQNICIGEDAVWVSTGKKMFFSIKSNTLSYPGSGVTSIKVYSGNYSSANELCSNTGSLSVDAGINYLTNCIKPTPVPDPAPTPVPSATIVKKGYYDYNGSRTYFIIYSDFRIVKTNSKYVPL